MTTIVKEGQLWEDVYPTSGPYSSRRLLVVTEILPKEGLAEVVSFYTHEPAKQRTTRIKLSRMTSGKQGFKLL